MLYFLFFIFVKTLKFSRKLCLLDHNPEDEESNVFENMDERELKSILASIDTGEEREMKKIKEKYFRLQHLYSRALALKRPEDNSSCPNISRLEWNILELRSREND